MSERQKRRLAQKELSRQKRRMIEKVLSSSNTAFNHLNLLVDGWLELESDPGTFSLLIEDFGCLGAQVEEVYDLEQKFEGPVFGFIFLFKWLNHNQHNDRLRNQKSTSNSADSTNDKNGEQSPEQKQWSYVEDDNIISEMFFAKQMISNSCATHALISILLNCDYDELNLGPTLTRLKEHTKVMNPENKGYAIGNLPEIAKAHNSHASYSSLYNRSRSSSHTSSGMSYIISGNQRTNLQQQNLHEAYHFVSYVPINDRLYELDGLKNFPIDHGPIGPKEDWTEKFRSVIKQRLFANKTGDDPTISNDIRYSLMAVVPDKRVYLKAEIQKLQHQREAVQENIKRLKETKSVFKPMSIDIDIPNPPYSPLSNGTITASEAGSEFDSPNHSLICDDDDDKIDRYFFIKFNQQTDAANVGEDNLEPAHKNCIIETESTDVHPLNLTVEVGSGSDEKVDQEKTNSRDLTNNNNNNNIDKACKKIKPTISKTDTEDNKDTKLSKNLEKNGNLKQDGDRSITSDLSVVQETHINGLIKNGDKKDAAIVDECSEVKANETPAHNNEKYNLSTKPPFDFNILDEMQHVHIFKSTLKDLTELSQRIVKEMEKLESSMKEEMDKRHKYRIDNARRTHNYEPFIMTFLSLLAKQGNLADLIEKDLGISSEEPPAVQVSVSACKTQKTSTTNATSNSNNKVPASNGSVASKTNSTIPVIAKKQKYKYVSTGRPVGRPRKNPLEPPPVNNKNSNSK